MAGIVFFKTNKLKELQRFYLQEVGCELWMDQGDCIILQHDDFLFGFCEREKAETAGIITFFYKAKQEVDRFYRKFSQIADSEPKDNPKYPIYHFFARDPENRIIEFQYFYNL